MSATNAQADGTYAVCHKILDYVEGTAAGEPNNPRLPWEIEKVSFLASWLDRSGDKDKSEQLSRRINQLLQKVYDISTHVEGQQASAAEAKYMELAIGSMLVELEQYQNLGEKHPNWGAFDVFALQVMYLGDRCIDMSSAQNAQTCYMSLRHALADLDRFDMLLVDALQKLGALYWMTNHLREAEETMSLALQVAQAFVSPNDPAVIRLQHFIQQIKEQQTPK